MKTWGHDELALDLASSLVCQDRMVWTDIQLGPAGSPRPDVYTISKSYCNPRPTAYECKISVADFRKDVTVGKWSTYLEYAHSVVFAAPAGLLSKDDIPNMCGLIVRHEGAWRLAKKATVNPRPIAQEALLKLLIDGIQREGPKVRARQWRDSTDKFSRKFGSTAARYVADAASIERDIENAEAQRQRMYADAEKECARIREKAATEAPPVWRSLLDVLGLASNATIWDIRRELSELKQAKDGGPERAAIRQMVNLLQRIVQNNEHFLKDERIMETG